MQFADGESAPQPTVGSFNVYVALPAEHKGTHMSRLVGCHRRDARALVARRMSALLDTMLQRLELTAAGSRSSFRGSYARLRRCPAFPA